MRLNFILPLAAAASFGLMASANAAIIITEEPGSNLASFSYSINDATRTITLREVWDAGTSGNVVLKFEGWDYNRDSWTVNKFVTNNTGDDWTSFSNELLNADKDGSIDTDGLSFAQFGVPFRPRTSDVFTTVMADEIADRDFLLFEDGLVANGSSVFMTFGLTARRDGEADNVNPFFLRQSETLAAIPEPATWAMLITGFGLVGFSMRRRRSTVASVTA